MRTEMVPISDRARSSGLKLDALFVGVLGLGLYWATLAPTVLWSDGGHLQLNAVRGLLQGSAGSHPVWVWVAHQFTKIPLGDIAGRVNLVSAVLHWWSPLGWDMVMVWVMKRRRARAATAPTMIRAMTTRMLMMMVVGWVRFIAIPMPLAWPAAR